MKIDKQMLTQLAALPDDQLWAMLRTVSGRIGVELGKTVPGEAEIAKLRSTLLSLSEEDIGRAAALLDAYRKGEIHG